MHEPVESEIINELLCRCYVRNGEEMAGDLSRYRIGSYGAGTLWCIRRQGTLLLVFNDTPIARRAKNATAEKSWMALDSSWSVKSLGCAEVSIQHNGGEGVIVSLQGDQ
jgi:hypothetical protein